MRVSTLNGVCPQYLDIFGYLKRENGDSPLELGTVAFFQTNPSVFFGVFDAHKLLSNLIHQPTD